jgi:ATP-dependent DNA helicase RecG
MQVEFYFDNNYFKVIIYNANYKIEDDIYDKNSTVNSTVKLSKTELAVVELIKDEPTITIESIATKLNKTESTIKKAIKNLKDNNFIVREGSDKTGYWKILG